MSESNMRNQVAIEIKNPSKYMTLTYVISLSIIAVLSGIVHFVLDKVIEEQLQTSKVVNVSGQQRMLSQRAGLFTLHYITTGETESRDLAMEAVNSMLANQQYLLKDHNEMLVSPLSMEMRELYFQPPHNVSRAVQVYTEIIETAVNRDYELSGPVTFEKESVAIELAKNSLITGLNALVEQYERESLQKVDELRFAQKLVFWIILLTIFIEAFFIFRPMVTKMALFASKLQREANYDSLSGVYNRRAFNVLARQNFALSKRHSHVMSIIMCDIDWFKNINDTYGHAAGDEVIKEVASTIQDSIRETDIVARYGGEEFMVLLPYTPEREAIFVAEKIRKLIEQNEIKTQGETLQVTVSIGVSGLHSDDKNAEAIIGRSDNALYQAKNSGRNKAFTYDGQEAEAQ